MTTAPTQFDVTPAFEALMQHLVELLESDDEDVCIDGDDAVQGDDAFGGRSGPNRFDFTVLAAGARWRLTLTERQVRDIADGFLRRVAGRREPR